jgi:hypothetical protein
MLMPDEFLDIIISDVAEFTFGSTKSPLLPRSLHTAHSDVRLKVVTAAAVE